VRAGLDVPVPVRRRIAEKVAGWLPLPAFLRFRRDDDEAAPAGGGGAWMAHVPSLSESLSSGWGKAAAGLAALLAAGAGVGVTTYVEGSKRDERGTGYRATETRSVSGPGAASAGTLRRAADRAGTSAGENVRRGGGSAAGGSSRGADAGSRAGDGDRAGAPGSGAGDGGGPLGLRTPELPGAAKDAPRIDAPKLNVGTKPLHDTVDSVTDTAKPVTDATKPVTDATKPVTDATKPVTDATKPATDATKPVTDAAEPVTGAAKPVTDAAEPVTGAAKPVTEAAKPVTDAAKPVTDAAEPVTDAAKPATDAVGDATGGGLPVP
jgi:hypothetical protein